MGLGYLTTGGALQCSRPILSLDAYVREEAVWDNRCRRRDGLALEWRLSENWLLSDLARNEATKPAADPTVNIL